jgi:hypothetical protein
VKTFFRIVAERAAEAGRLRRRVEALIEERPKPEAGTLSRMESRARSEGRLGEAESSSA